MVGYANLVDALAAEGGTQSWRQQGAWALDKFPIQIDEVQRRLLEFVGRAAPMLSRTLRSPSSGNRHCTNCIRGAAIAAGRDSTGDVKELRANAKSVRRHRVPAVTSEIP